MYVVIEFSNTTTRGFKSNISIVITIGMESLDIYQL